MTDAVSAQGDMIFVELDGVWKKIRGIKSIPEIGEIAEKIDATTLESEMKEYIKDIPDQGDLEFVFTAIPIGKPESNVELLQGMSRNGEYRWKWVSPRLNTQVIWRGEFAYRYGAGEISTVRDLILTLIPKSRPIESPISAQYTVTYDSNGGSGGPMTDASSPYDNGAIATAKTNEFTPPEGKKFVMWNTDANNAGDAYDEGDTFAVYKNTVLYAIWSD